MLSHLFLGLSLVGAEWVLYLLVFLSIISLSVIFERAIFYRQASRGLADFRSQFRSAGLNGNWQQAEQTARSRVETSVSQGRRLLDLESEMALEVLRHVHGTTGRKPSAEVLSELARDAVVRCRLSWDRNLSILATIGNIAPFIGLFGTVLGIIKAFHDLSQQAAGNAAAVTAGISEALVTTAIGIMVAIPAVVAFNFFSRKVRTAMAEAEALKSFLVGKLAE